MKFGVGVALIGLIIFSSLLLAESSSCAGRQCLKSDLHSDAKSKESTHNHSSAVASMSHHGNDNTDNAENSMDMENQGMSRKATKEQESKEFESQDYRSYDPSPSFRQPPHKLIPNR
ncbi:hypothetical protein SUGI_1037680 [Cryptomeria japonica]|uniref:uncharacterized protein LOC131077478 n=1 Tax=Cryptomeria japonica TaxID=3369 RepID=UPI002414C9F5|nr:uncharacterized protein LOC131077478 [Cryptomeria japonica]XP_057870950.1 uncharacterized protein LOC131077478 [Cryptomeria japonica]XP_057870951.1 uncharacterized protein LOC131077478 [Cryptomeria japonica]GLJ49178.1 hypothetical protein SUGI_1037680 [Cryptomeria japonica]